MSTLTGQAIKDTYDGLLKLADSTNPITSTPQQIQDGLGNNTNTRISTLGIISPNVMNINSLKPDYGGVGFTAAAGANVAAIQNRTLYYPFFDSGFNSYSAITYNSLNATTTNDVVSAAFYSMQLVQGIGFAPKDLIQSGITMVVNSTGIKTTTLPSTLSFSGTGGGYYMIAFYMSNSGTTPTARYAATNTNVISTAFGYGALGFYLNAAGTVTNIGSKYNSTTMNVLNLPFQSAYTSSDITTNYVTTITTQPYYGFSLNTII
jgi:hypothetical protein